jgi:hypothetical protein
MVPLEQSSRPCAICGNMADEPIIVRILRQSGAIEERVVCSETCEQRLWEREEGHFSSYEVVSAPSDASELVR